MVLQGIQSMVLTLGQGRNQKGGNRSIAPQKFSQTYVFVRYSNKLPHFAPPPKISVGCGPALGNGQIWLGPSPEVLDLF